MIKATEITAKLFVGEEVSYQDREYLMEYNNKYEEVCRKYLEHRNAGKDPEKDAILVKFHFSPTDKFMESSADDIVAELIEWDKAVAEGRVERTRLHFEDLVQRQSNPPKTGLKKKSLL